MGQKRASQSGVVTWTGEDRTDFTARCGLPRITVPPPDDSRKAQTPTDDSRPSLDDKVRVLLTQ